MKFAIAFVFTSILCFTSTAQEEDSIITESQSLGFGIGNLGTTITEISSGNHTFSSIAQYLVEYKEEHLNDYYYRIGIGSNISTERIGGIRNYYFVPLHVYCGIEKQKHINKLTLTAGADAFFSVSLRGAQLGTGSWVTDDYGLGIAPNLGINYRLNDQWSIASEFGAGGGMFREFKNVGTTTRPVIVPKFYLLKGLSLTARYFW